MESFPYFCLLIVPFYHPIEVVFGLIKKAFKRSHIEGTNKPLEVSIANVLEDFHSFDLTAVFEHCGWKANGVFDPVGPLRHDTLTIAGFTHNTDNLLEFEMRDGFDKDDENNDNM
ncbi:hypothetical protein AC1031_016749 [Aphanomyces cochlioides]|nr:hypothetical protein AC1031_016749 [Aphanomyces cochlioides]